MNTLLVLSPPPKNPASLEASVTKGNKMATRSNQKREKRKNTKDSIHFAKGFRLPTPKQSLSAVGATDLPNYLKTGSKNEHFGSIPQPTCENDWLAMYNETGQTFKSFIRTCPWLLERKVKYIKQRFVSAGRNMREKYPDGKIYIQPLGEFSDVSSPCIEDLAHYAECFYSIPVVVLPTVKLDLPTQKGSLQIRADSIHNQLQQTIPNDALCLVGLTMADLYEDDPDLFVAGLAAGNLRVAVFSFARYDPTVTFSTEFWYEITHSKKMEIGRRRTLVLQRSCKLLVHEIAHLFGVDHCIWYSCCMNGSGHLEEDFAQPMFLCPVDLHKLQQLCGFDVVLRYRKLLEFCDEHGLADEASWLKDRLRFIVNAT